MKKNFIRIIEIAHLKLFGCKMSDEMRLFFSNLRYVAIGYGFAALFLFAFQVLAGRFLGPISYGKYILATSVGGFLAIFIMFGLYTAMIKYNAEKKEYARQSTIISTTFFMILFSSSIFMTIYIILAHPLSKIFHLPLEIFYLACIFALFYVLYMFLASALQGLFEMKKLSYLQLSYGPVLFLLLISFVILKIISYKTMVFCLIGTNIIISIASLVILRSYIKFIFSRFWFKKLINYSIYGAMGGIASAFYLNIDKLLINKFLTQEDVGIYGAYYFVFISTLISLYGIINVVFFPFVSRHRDKRLVFEKINKSLPFLASLLFLSIIIFGYIVLKFYGHAYTFKLTQFPLFAFAGVCMIFYGLYVWLMASEGRRGIRITGITGIVFAFLNVLLNLILIPRLGINGAVLALIIPCIILTGFIFHKSKIIFS